MATTFKPVLLLFVLISLFLSSSAQTCSSYTFSSGKSFSKCSDLPVLNSYLYWTYYPSTGTADIAYRHTGVSSSRWVAWAINPGSKAQMVGAQALVAYKHSNGSILAYTSSISSYETTLQQSSLSFSVSNISAELVSNVMIIYATVKLPSTTVNHLWQDGPVSGNSPTSHQTSGNNLASAGSMNFLSGATTATSGGTSRTKRKNVHGVLNAVSWGILLPIGAMIARYLKVFKAADPAWFYLHLTCQTSAYVIGVAGWATGLKLGSESSGVQYDAHRNIGITLFVLGTLQVFALLLRPKKEHKFRLYWNIYHHSVGYCVIILSIVNIYKGFDILDPEKKWKKAYTGIIVILGIIALILEVITWVIVLKRKRSRSTEKSHHGVNGVNGYGATPGV
ncbi:cytochrome b561 and DOMON domain-containing protein At5g47530-like [Macadamia integrifolia]|uniref:cytochrome b561 and DOMON domain-containing protein At5g47530-like n=1 Tax=Macadamia integrifolia TaxID=60698 RepID=UPI001C534105|nr:cytochrome b561 and DOMON domain-containing protein At5g47530-like [Macadamia integrifolia]